MGAACCGHGGSSSGTQPFVSPTFLGGREGFASHEARLVSNAFPHSKARRCPRSRRCSRDGISLARHRTRPFATSETAPEIPAPRAPSPSVSPGRGGLRFSPHHPAAIPARLPHPNHRLVPAPAVPRSDDATRRAPPLPRQATPNAPHDYHDPSPALREMAASARLAPAAASRPPPQGAGRARAAPSEPGGTSRTKPPLARPPLAT